MKKFIILISITIIAISAITYGIYQSKINQKDIAINNKDYDYLLNTSISGTELATLMNKTLNKNKQNNVEKDSDGIYIDNNKNSINIDIKFLQSSDIYSEEKIQKNDISKFIQYYSIVKFKCTKIEYHNETKLVSYLYFEEIEA